MERREDTEAGAVRLPVAPTAPESPIGIKTVCLAMPDIRISAPATLPVTDVLGPIGALYIDPSKSAWFVVSGRTVGRTPPAGGRTPATRRAPHIARTVRRNPLPARASGRLESRTPPAGFR